MGYVQGQAGRSLTTLCMYFFKNSLLQLIHLSQLSVSEEEKGGHKGGGNIKHHIKIVSARFTDWFENCGPLDVTKLQLPAPTGCAKVM